MPGERSTRRMTLRQLLTHVEKCGRDLIVYIQATVGPRLADFRELSRPVRRRSHYPTMFALMNALKKLVESGAEIQVLGDYLLEQMEEIREHAQQERSKRM